MTTRRTLAHGAPESGVSSTGGCGVTGGSGGVGAAIMVTVTLPVTVFPLASVTSTPNVNVPAVAGVPVIDPSEFRVSPPGKVPEPDSVKVNGELSPVAVTDDV